MSEPESGTARDTRAVLPAVRAGDSSALAHVYAAHADMVYQTAFRLLGAAADAEDVLQDVFVGLPHALRAYDERGQFDAWLRRVTVRAALMKRRAVSRRREEDIDLVAAHSTTDSAFDIADRLTIKRAIESLPHEMRVVFMLKEVEGYSHAEIAQIVGITSGASAARLFRAWQLLRSTQRDA